MATHGQGDVRRYAIDFRQLANYTLVMNDLGKVIKQQRLMASLTLQQLASMSGVSVSHLGRIERGERYPSASILRKIAQPLGYGEDELFTLADYLSPRDHRITKADPDYSGYLAPDVARMLAAEPVEVQHAVTGILSVLKSIASSIAQGSR